MARLGWLGLGAAGALAAGGLALARRRPRLLTAERDGIQVPRSRKALLSRLHRSHQLGVELMELAIARAERESIRDFASTLKLDHEKADYEVRLTAQRLGIALGKPIPANASELAQVSSQNANRAKLERLHGLAFDHAFLAVLLGDLDHSIGQLELGAEIFSDGDVGSLCKAALPSTYAHRRKTLELCEKSAPDREFLSTGDHPPTVET